MKSKKQSCEQYEYHFFSSSFSSSFSSTSFVVMDIIVVSVVVTVITSPLTHPPPFPLTPSSSYSLSHSFSLFLLFFSLIHLIYSKYFVKFCEKNDAYFTDKLPTKVSKNFKNKITNIFIDEFKNILMYLSTNFLKIQLSKELKKS